MNVHLKSQGIHQSWRYVVGVLLICLSIYSSGFRSGVSGDDSHIASGEGCPPPLGKNITLEDALNIAMKNNLQLQSTQDQVDAAAGALRQSKLYPNPVLELLAEEVPTNEMGLNQSQNLVGITQPIITAGKRKLGIKLSEQSKEKSEFERDSVTLQVMTSTKKAFYKVVADQEGITVARHIEAIAKGIYESEQMRFEAGEVALTNVLRAEVELSQARNAVSLAEGNLQTSLSELQTVMGIPEESLAGVTGKLLTTPPDVSFNDLKLAMQVNQPLIKASRKGVEMAESQLSLEKRQAIPDINVSAGYKRLTQENADTVQMGIEIPTPFFNRNQGNIQKGKALSRKAKNENQSVYNDLQLQLKRDVDSYHAERKRVAEFRDNILPKAEISLQLIGTGYKEGELSYIDLLDAQRTWAETKVAYIESLKKINLLLADIEGLAVIKIRE